MPYPGDGFFTESICQFHRRICQLTIGMSSMLLFFQRSWVFPHIGLSYDKKVENLLKRNGMWGVFRRVPRGNRCRRDDYECLLFTRIIAIILASSKTMPMNYGKRHCLMWSFKGKIYSFGKRMTINEQ